MTAILNNAPIPATDPIAQKKRPEFGQRPDPREGTMTGPWVDWFSQLIATMEKAPGRIGSVALTAKDASVGATDFSGGSVSAGLYRVSIFARITRAATVSSSLTVLLDWVDGGVTLSFTWPALTGNTITTVLLGPPVLIHVDGSPIRYSTTYASVGATSMLYSLSVTLEEVQA